MAQVRVEVGGRSYPLACKDGEEQLLQKLATHVNAKAEQLSGQLGHLPEARLLLMAAIMLADDYEELASGKAKTADTNHFSVDAQVAETRATDAVKLATQKIESAAAALEKAASAS